jgi:hypothetical protein
LSGDRVPVVDVARLYITFTVSLLVLALIALPFLEPGSPSYVVDLFAILILSIFLSMLVLLRIARRIW